jgi:hypothetical protein
VLRVLNPGDTAVAARVRPGFAFERATPVRLDEEPAAFALSRQGAELHFEVPAHALRSLLVR